MPFCPNCNYEYVAGILICPDCNERLTEALELKDNDELSEKDWVLIYSSFNEIDIEMIRNNLESAGISVSVISQKDSIFPVPGNLSVIKLFVRKDDVKAALEFIQGLMSNTNPDEQENSDE